jgi:hypothetical protein
MTTTTISTTHRESIHTRTIAANDLVGAKVDNFTEKQ